jgi:uncharacterized protein (TIGR03643 family)
MGSLSATNSILMPKFLPIMLNLDKCLKYKIMDLPDLDSETIDRVLEMAWEDRTTFESIELQFGLLEKQVIALMRREMKASSFRMWRKRVTGRSTKHATRRDFIAGRFKCPTQK